jgi:hypothetical protein
MPSIALRAHFDGHHVVFDEDCDLPPETPLLVIINPAGQISQEPATSQRHAAFDSAFGAMQGKLSTSDEFMARKAEEKAFEEGSSR